MGRYFGALQGLLPWPAAANEWLERYAQFWEANFQRLDALLSEMKTAKKKPARSKR